MNTQNRLLTGFLAVTLALAAYAGPALAAVTLSILPVNRGGTGAATLDGAGVVQKTGAQTVAGVKTFTSPIVYKHGTTISAGATQTQAGATALTSEFNNVTTCATAGDGVKLPTAVAGQTITVKNNGATALAVYPATDDAIDNLSADASLSLPVNAQMTFRAKDAVTWESSTEVVYPRLGVAPAFTYTMSPRMIHTGGVPATASTSGTDATPVATEVYIGEIFVPANTTMTGVANFNGSVASGNIKVGLASSAGAILATSASTAMSGTDAYQLVPFTATYAAVGPATYFVLLFVDNNTARVNTHTVGAFGASKQTGQTYSTGFTTITPPTTFTTGLAPIATTY